MGIDEGARSGDWGPSWQSDKLQQALIDVRTALEASEIDDDPAFRREVFLLLLDNRLTDDETVFGMPYLANLGTYGPPADGDDPYANPVHSARVRTACVAESLGITPQQANELFVVPSVDHGNPQLRVSPSRLDRDTATAVRQIVLLLAAAHEPIASPVATAELRRVAQEYGRFDVEFDEHLARIDGVRFLGDPCDGNSSVLIEERGSVEARKVAAALLS